MLDILNENLINEGKDLSLSITTVVKVFVVCVLYTLMVERTGPDTGITTCQFAHENVQRW
jgi:hypothetical protein